MPLKSPFIPKPPPQQAELPVLGLSLPASTRLAPAPTAQHPGHLGSSSMLPALLVPNLSLPPSSAVHGAAQPHSTAAAGAGVLPCCRRRLLLRDCLYPSALGAGMRVAALLGHVLPPLDSFRVQETCSFHFRSGTNAAVCLLGPSRELKPLPRKGRWHRLGGSSQARQGSPLLPCAASAPVPKHPLFARPGGSPGRSPRSAGPRRVRPGPGLCPNGWAPLPSRALLRTSPSLRARREGRTEAEEPASLSHFLC